MPIAQINLRVPREHHDLARRMAARLRNDPAFAQSVAVLLEDPSRSTALFDATKLQSAIDRLQQERDAAVEALQRERDDGVTVIQNAVASTLKTFIAQAAHHSGELTNAHVTGLLDEWITIESKPLLASPERAAVEEPTVVGDHRPGTLPTVSRSNTVIHQSYGEATSNEKVLDQANSNAALPSGVGFAALASRAAPPVGRRRLPTVITPEIERGIWRLRHEEHWTRDRIAQHLGIGGGVVSRIMNRPA